MAKIRNKSGMDLEVPGRGVAVADGLLEIPDEDVYAYTASANWDPADKDATAAHNKGERAESRAVKAAAKASDDADPAAVPGSTAPVSADG